MIVGTWFSEREALGSLTGLSLGVTAIKSTLKPVSKRVEEMKYLYMAVRLY